MIEVSGLSENISFSVRRGEVFGLISPSPGAASRVLKVLSGERRPSSGRVRISGRAGLVRNSIPGFSDRSSVLQNLEFWSVFWNLFGKKARQRVREVLDETGLASAASTRVGALNLEQRFRLNVARSLLGRPDILLFDGFSGGLDPWSARAVRSWIREEWAGRQGRTAVLVSNQIQDITETCDRVVLLREGRLVWQGAGKEFSLDRIHP